jgi:hypothetical protein
MTAILGVILMAYIVFDMHLDDECDDIFHTNCNSVVRIIKVIVFSVQEQVYVSTL